MIKVGIIGGAGYTAGELIRILINHPAAEIVFVQSSSNAGNPVTSVHEDLAGETDLLFTSEMPLEKVDVVFLCMGHGKSVEFMQNNNLLDWCFAENNELISIFVKSIETAKKNNNKK